MKRLTILFITLSIAAFVWLSLSGINFIQTSTVKEEEGFATSTGTGPITRASDCNCLPGYIPSSESGDYNGKIFQISWMGTQYLFNPEGTKKVYWINPNNSCGITMTGTYPSLALHELFGNGSQHSYSGILQCNLVQKKQPTQPHFFCQNLMSPEKRRKCY
jgi:hypothetical protein